MSRLPVVSTPRPMQPTYAELFEAHGGLCAGCWQPERLLDRFGQPIRLSVYINTTVRPNIYCLLCKSCTLALSLLRDCQETLGRLRDILNGKQPIAMTRLQEVRLHLSDGTEPAT